MRDLGTAPPPTFTPDDGLTPLVATLLPGDPGVNPYVRLVPSGPGTRAVKDALQDLDPQRLLSAPVVRRDDAECLMSGLWLWHDWLDASHTISQSIGSASGSFWHAIMHRREGDFSNSKYWNARCRRHPAHAAMAAGAGAALSDPALGRWASRLTRNGWDPDAFVDLVDDVHGRPDDPAHAAAVRLQRLEWQALFAHCARAAVGR